MIIQRPNIQTYDPRLGQDYKFHFAKTTFSSLERGLFVLEAVGEMDWGVYQDALLECILKTSAKGFFMVVPWFHGIKKLRCALLRQFGEAKEVNNAVLGYFKPSADKLSGLFSIRDECGGASSGEWCIGGCSTEFSEQDIKCAGWSINFICLLHQAEKIGCVLSLEEMQQSYFITIDLYLLI